MRRRKRRRGSFIDLIKLRFVDLGFCWVLRERVELGLTTVNTVGSGFTLLYGDIFMWRFLLCIGR